MNLIVNADDLGMNAETTDAILAEHRDGRISSTTAMVFMADSERAAGAASEQGLACGLHLNLTEPFTAADVPRAIRATQASLTTAFGAHLQRRRWSYDPRIQREVDRALAAQLTEFHRLFGRAPTHLDGHQHVHATLNVLLSSALRVGLPYRRTVIDNHSASRPARTFAQVRQRLADRRFPAPSGFLTLEGFFRPDTTAASRDWLDQAEPVEVMVHPGNREERALLQSGAWADLARPHALASYDVVRRG